MLLGPPGVPNEVVVPEAISQPLPQNPQKRCYNFDELPQLSTFPTHVLNRLTTLPTATTRALLRNP